MKRPIMTEADMAARVVAWLEKEGFTIFQEVQLHKNGTRADIVATRGAWESAEGELWVVECKKQLSFELFAQAIKWQPYAHQVVVAVPEAKHSEGRALAFGVALSLGLGAFDVKSLWPIEEERVEPLTLRALPPKRPTIDPRLFQALRAEHQTHAQAGTNRGGHFTRFKQTIAAIAARAVEHPGESLRQCLAHVDHHYASINSGISHLSTYVETGVIKDFALRVDDGCLRVFPAGAA